MSEGWPTLLSEYQLDSEPIGKGRKARVYRGKWKNNEVALKVVSKKNLKRSEAEQLRNEIVVHSQLQHENVVDIHHAFETSTEVVLVLEKGDDNLSCLVSSSFVSEARLRTLLGHILHGLAYLHGMRFYHGDVSLENMILMGSGQVKLCDFSKTERFSDDRKANDRGPENDLAQLAESALELLTGTAGRADSTIRRKYDSSIISHRCRSCLESMRSSTVQEVLSHPFFISVTSIPRIMYDPRNEELPKNHDFDFQDQRKQPRSAPGGVRKSKSSSALNVRSTCLKTDGRRDGRQGEHDHEDGRNGNNRDDERLSNATYDVSFGRKARSTNGMMTNFNTRNGIVTQSLNGNIFKTRADRSAASEKTRSWNDNASDLHRGTLNTTRSSGDLLMGSSRKAYDPDRYIEISAIKDTSITSSRDVSAIVPNLHDFKSNLKTDRDEEGRVREGREEKRREPDGREAKRREQLKNREANTKREQIGGASSSNSPAQNSTRHKSRPMLLAESEGGREDERRYDASREKSSSRGNDSKQSSTRSGDKLKDYMDPRDRENHRDDDKWRDIRRDDDPYRGKGDACHGKGDSGRLNGGRNPQINDPGISMLDTDMDDTLRLLRDEGDELSNRHVKSNALRSGKDSPQSTSQRSWQSFGSGYLRRREDEMLRSKLESDDRDRGLRRFDKDMLEKYKTRGRDERNKENDHGRGRDRRHIDSRERYNDNADKYSISDSFATNRSKDWSEQEMGRFDRDMHSETESRVWNEKYRDKGRDKDIDCNYRHDHRRSQDSGERNRGVRDEYRDDVRQRDDDRYRDSRDKYRDDYKSSESGSRRSDSDRENDRVRDGDRHRDDDGYRENDRHRGRDRFPDKDDGRRRHDHGDGRRNDDVDRRRKNDEPIFKNERRGLTNKIQSIMNRTEFEFFDEEETEERERRVQDSEPFVSSLDCRRDRNSSNDDSDRRYGDRKYDCKRSSDGNYKGSRRDSNERSVDKNYLDKKYGERETSLELDREIGEEYRKFNKDMNLPDPDFEVSPERPFIDRVNQMLDDGSYEEKKYYFGLNIDKPLLGASDKILGKITAENAEYVRKEEMKKEMKLTKGKEVKKTQLISSEFHDELVKPSQDEDFFAHTVVNRIKDLALERKADGSFVNDGRNGGLLRPAITKLEKDDGISVVNDVANVVKAANDDILTERWDPDTRKKELNITNATERLLYNTPATLANESIDLIPASQLGVYRSTNQNQNVGNQNTSAHNVSSFVNESALFLKGPTDSLPQFDQYQIGANHEQKYSGLLEAAVQQKLNYNIDDEYKPEHLRRSFSPQKRDLLTVEATSCVTNYTSVLSELGNNLWKDDYRGLSPGRTGNRGPALTNQALLTNPGCSANQPTSGTHASAKGPFSMPVTPTSRSSLPPNLNQNHAGYKANQGAIEGGDAKSTRPMFASSAHSGSNSDAEKRSLVMHHGNSNLASNGLGHLSLPPNDVRTSNRNPFDIIEKIDNHNFINTPNGSPVTLEFDDVVRTAKDTDEHNDPFGWFGRKDGQEDLSPVPKKDELGNMSLAAYLPAVRDSNDRTLRESRDSDNNANDDAAHDVLLSLYPDVLESKRRGGSNETVAASKSGSECSAANNRKPSNQTHFYPEKRTSKEVNSTRNSKEIKLGKTNKNPFRPSPTPTTPGRPTPTRKEGGNREAVRTGGAEKDDKKRGGPQKEGGAQSSVADSIAASPYPKTGDGWGDGTAHGIGVVDTRRIKKPFETVIQNKYRLHIASSGEVRIDGNASTSDKGKLRFVIEPNGVTCKVVRGEQERRYDHRKLPQKLKQWYSFAFSVVNRLRSRTPKVILHSEDCRCELMDNVPFPDFQIHLLTLSSNIETVTVTNGTTVTLVNRTGTRFELPLELVLQMSSGEKPDVELDRLLMHYHWELGDIKDILKLVRDRLHRALKEERTALQSARMGKLVEIQKLFQPDASPRSSNFDSAWDEYERGFANAFPVVKRI